MKPWVIVVVILIVILALAAVAGAVLVWSLSDRVSVSRNTVLELSLGNEINEGRSENPFDVVFEGDRLSLYDYWQLLDYAATDSRVKAIYLEITPSSLNWAQIEELRTGLLHFRESGKPVHAFLAVDLVGELELYLASAADSITVNPDAAFLVNGLMAEVTFFKGALEKLEIQPDFIQFKEFKSPDVYQREQMSAPIREMFQSLIGDLEDRLVRQLAADRKLDESALKDAMALGVQSADQAVEMGLVDAEGYRDEVRDRLSEAAGEDFELLAAKQYVRANRSAFDPSSRYQVALVVGEGLITAGESDAFSDVLGGSTLAAHLKQVRENERFDGVLLRVDSPGGSAVGSDMVWREVELLREAGKPVVVSMAGVAGSGGYYISMGADRIICQPSTLTGSIGVIFGKFDFEGFLNYLGVTVDRVKLSPNADVLSPFSSLSSNQKEAVTEWIRTIYSNFVSKAAEGRNLSAEELEERARGRIYTGEQALAAGLIDDLGGYGAALRHLRVLLEVPEQATIRLVAYPPPKTFWEVLSESPFAGAAAARSPLPEWVRKEWSNLTQAMPRLIMPEARIY